MKTVVLKRHVKLKDLKYHIDGEETIKPLAECASAVGIGLIIALVIIAFGIAFI